MTKEEFVKKSNNIHNNIYDYSIVKYKNINTKVNIICKKCQNIFEITPKNHFHGKGCKKCFNDKRRKNISELINQFNKIHNFKYNYSKIQYKNINTKVIIICKKHGEFLQSPYSHLKGQGCKLCHHDSMRKNNFIERAKNIHKDQYDYSKCNYVNWKKKVIIICKKHGEFLQSPFIHLNNHGCPQCKTSINELKIKNWLIQNNISFIQQYKFDTCKGIKRKLPFDFYLPNHNICIEYDGEQHFKPIFNNIIDFEKRLKYDEIKNNFCKLNNIKLIRISYKNKNDIDNILKNNII